MTSQLPDAFRPRWWHRDLVRLPVAGAVVVGFLVLYGTAPHTVWEWPLGDSVALEMSPRGLLLSSAVLAELFVLPRVSYRFRDVLWVWFPLVGAVLAVKLVYRAMLLPRRDWTPRPDELPAAVRLPAAAASGSWHVTSARPRTTAPGGAATPGTTTPTPAGSRRGRWGAGRTARSRPLTGVTRPGRLRT